jgi:hypothetical protein
LERGLDLRESLQGIPQALARDAEIVEFPFVATLQARRESGGFAQTRLQYAFDDFSDLDNAL